MTPEFVKRYSAPVPRYTSYPTAPHFTDKVQSLQYLDWLSELPRQATLSLYFHIPFCQSLCWYCGCSTKAVRSYDPVSFYLSALYEELANVAALVPRTHNVTHIHWGGGTPNILAPSDIQRLAGETRQAFNLADDAEFAVEIDPRTLELEQIAALASAGVNRVSIGVQDFDLDVQRAINREQSVETTRRAVDLFRVHGIRSINIDLVYGLPHQSRASVARTVDQVLALNPDRIATFGYAHLPTRLKRQRLIDEKALPDAVERFAQSQRLARLLTAAGYVRVGLDHFALPTDVLAGQTIGRNFQGYTTDRADALLGLGVSAIGKLLQGYVQNAVSRGEYVARIQKIGLATVRGIELTTEDRMRAYVIESLMCRFALSWGELERHFGSLAHAIWEEAEAIAETNRDGLVEQTSEEFRVTERGRPFVRAICACFDAYLDRAPVQHALGV